MTKIKIYFKNETELDIIAIGTPRIDGGFVIIPMKGENWFSASEMLYYNSDDIRSMLSAEIPKE